MHCCSKVCNVVLKDICYRSVRNCLVFKCRGEYNLIAPVIDVITIVLITLLKIRKHSLDSLVASCSGTCHLQSCLCHSFTVKSRGLLLDKQEILITIVLRAKDVTKTVNQILINLDIELKTLEIILSPLSRSFRCDVVVSISIKEKNSCGTKMIRIRDAAILPEVLCRIAKFCFCSCTITCTSIIVSHLLNSCCDACSLKAVILIDKWILRTIDKVTGLIIGCNFNCIRSTECLICSSNRHNSALINQRLSEPLKDCILIVSYSANVCEIQLIKAIFTDKFLKSICIICIILSKCLNEGDCSSYATNIRYRVNKLMTTKVQSEMKHNRNYKKTIACLHLELVKGILTISKLISATAKVQILVLPESCILIHLCCGTSENLL